MINQIIQFLNNKQHKEIILPFSKDTFEILNLLEKEGYLNIYSSYKNTNPLKSFQNENKNSHLKIKKNCKIINWQIKQISKPSRKIYLNFNNISQLNKFGLGVSIFKTSKGFLTDKDCIWQQIGGEWLFKIF